MAEKHYDFRKFLNTVHRKDRRDFSLRPHPGETEISNGWNIRIDENASDFILNTARDLADYLCVSMNLCIGVEQSGGGLPDENIIVLKTGLRTKCVKRSFRLECSPGKIVVTGADERGTAMGVYYLEDVMNLRESPFIPHTKGLLKEPLFSPRMIHSGYGMDLFTAPYLRRIAHEGFDAVLVYVREPDKGVHGYTDFNEIIDMAEETGLDVYLYSSIKNIYHPSDREAPAFYEANYGGLFRRYPKAAGLILVGESCQFPSHDPHTTMNIASAGECCYRSGKAMPGWWPCSDFPEFVDIVQRSVRKYAPEADIVFWTYNWAHAPEKLRTKLIDDLPGNVTVEVNFEMHDNVKTWGTQERILDYSLSRTGPSAIFRSEGAAAKRSRHTLYTISNTAGKTWDIGAVPFLPTPYQWGKRIENLHRARKEFGLSGLMESHHYGWFPSFISEFAKWSFWSEAPAQDEILRALAVRDFSGETADSVLSAWREWSEAVGEFITPIEDQYGPCRVGPSFPFLFAGVSLRSTFGMNMKFPWTRLNRYEIAFPEYVVVNDPNGLDFGARRIAAEIKHLPGVIEKWHKGIALLEKVIAKIPERKRENARKTVALARYIANTLTTTLHIKQWWVENHRLLLETDPAEAAAILERIVAIAKEEIQNVRDTLPLVRLDSSLGYEPSMDYVCDEEHLEWKLRQMNAVLTIDIPNYRKGLEIGGSLKTAEASLRKNSRKARR